jgi:hypothetical protein
MITDNAICIHKIKSRIVMAETALNREKTLLAANWVLISGIK